MNRSFDRVGSEKPEDYATSFFNTTRGTAQGIESILSVDLGPLRTYGGGEYLFGQTPGNVVSRVAHGGIELRQPGGLAAAGRMARVRLIAALDVKSADELDWSVAWSARAGFEVGRTPGAEHRSRRWSLLAEYYDGPSPYGQFFRDQVSYYGVGLHVGP